MVYLVKIITLVVAFSVGCSCITPKPDKCPSEDDDIIDNGVTVMNVKDGTVIINFDADIYQDSMDKFIAIVEKYQEDPEVTNFIVRLNSRGGSVVKGFKIAETMTSSKKNFICVVDKHVGSMGFFIFEMCDVRVMTESATLMTHEPKIELKGSQDRFALLGQAKVLEEMSETMAKILSKRMNISIDIYQMFTLHRDWNMDAETAKIMEAVDEVIKD
jgi:ATP-dependent protease ClpP protease subunit